ncbi:MAG: hypothetical protein MdMp024_0040 [Bacteroidales bacterium]
MKMKIQAGKRYVTRDYQVVEIEKIIEKDPYPVHGRILHSYNSTPWSWTEEGKCSTEIEHDLDLLFEMPAIPERPVKKEKAAPLCKPEVGKKYNLRKIPLGCKNPAVVIIYDYVEGLPFPYKGIYDGKFLYFNEQGFSSHFPSDEYDIINQYDNGQ